MNYLDTPPRSLSRTAGDLLASVIDALADIAAAHDRTVTDERAVSIDIALCRRALFARELLGGELHERRVVRVYRAATDTIPAPGDTGA